MNGCDKIHFQNENKRLFYGCNISSISVSSYQFPTVFTILHWSSEQKLTEQHQQQTEIYSQTKVKTIHFRSFSSGNDSLMNMNIYNACVYCDKFENENKMRTKTKLICFGFFSFFTWCIFDILMPSFELIWALRAPFVRSLLSFMGAREIKEEEKSVTTEMKAERAWFLFLSQFLISITVYSVSFFSLWLCSCTQSVPGEMIDYMNPRAV